MAPFLTNFDECGEVRQTEEQLKKEDVLIMFYGGIRDFE